MLILDEPTNHLDLESREALEDALRRFGGSLLLVTHDRALLDAVGTRTVAVEDHGLRSYVGGWAEYARVREERKARGEAPDSAAPRPAPAPRPAAAGQAGPSRVARRRQRRARRRTAGASRSASSARSRRPRRALAALEDELADPKSWATKYESAKSTARHTAAKRAVEEAYAQLEAFEASAPAG